MLTYGAVSALLSIGTPRCYTIDDHSVIKHAGVFLRNEMVETLLKLVLNFADL